MSKDVLIRAGANDIAHKWATNVPSGHECYWTVNGTPRQTEPGRRIWVVSPTLGDIFAWGEITKLEDGKIWFTPLRETHVEPPEQPPTRGFTYTDPVVEQLAEKIDGAE